MISRSPQDRAAAKSQARVQCDKPPLEAPTTLILDPCLRSLVQRPLECLSGARATKRSMAPGIGLPQVESDPNIQIRVGKTKNGRRRGVFVGIPPPTKKIGG